VRFSIRGAVPSRETFWWRWSWLVPVNGLRPPERQPRVARHEASAALEGPPDERNAEAAPREIALWDGWYIRWVNWSKG
jgi:hypothetical protein